MLKECKVHGLLVFDMGLSLKGGGHSDRVEMIPVSSVILFNQTNLCSEENYVEEIVFCS